MFLKFIAGFTLITITLLVPSCTEKSNKTISPQQGSTKVSPSILVIKSPLANTEIISGAKIHVEVKADTSIQRIDSIQFSTDNEKIALVKSPLMILEWSPGNLHAGRNRLYFKAYHQGELVERAQTFIVVKAADAPREFSYIIVKTYPHDSMAYTQGLYYENGWMYESTGQYGRSSLRKVKLSTGEIEQTLNLPNEIFGEGMAATSDRLVQITWKSQVGYVYDKSTFHELSKVNYTTEGWGLCYDGTQFIMSDGTEQLYLMDKENFSEVGRIEVYDNKGPVKQLNELEYIDGKVYANVYGESYIVIINPSTGFVEGKINFEKIIPSRYKGDLDHTLNGIAWNPSTGHLFITGKEWKLIYEVILK